MKVIAFKIHMCGMSDRTISRKILIDKPFKTITKVLSLTYCLKNNISTVDELISYIKSSTVDITELLGEYFIDNFTVENIYIKHKGYLIGFQENKYLPDIFNYFKRGIIEFDYICVVGGASREHCGYKFIIHSNEEIHKNMPHTHVEKDGVSPRYLLDTFERIPTDEYLHEHSRDEKKIIQPFIKKNIKWFKEKWLMSVNGYIPPVETETGKQFCKET